MCHNCCTVVIISGEDLQPKRQAPDTCDSCVAAGYGWNAGNCWTVEHCRLIADSVCYTEMAGCVANRQSIAVSEICHGQTSCDACTNAHDDCGWDGAWSAGCYNTAFLFFEPEGLVRNSSNCAKISEGETGGKYISFGKTPDLIFQFHCVIAKI